MNVYEPLEKFIKKKRQANFFYGNLEKFFQSIVFMILKRRGIWRYVYVTTIKQNYNTIINQPNTCPNN